MPIYEYECRKCGTFEVTQRITESPLRRCPTCKGKVSRLLSAPSFQFKGSGWYVTDYASNKGSGEKKSESSDPKSETKSSSGEKKDAAKDSPSSSKDSKASDTKAA